MVRTGLEDRCEINGVDSQALNVIELFLDAKQIAAIEDAAEVTCAAAGLIVWIAQQRVPGSHGKGT